MSLPIIYHPDYVTPLPPNHRFPMGKFGLLYQILIREGVIQPQQVYQPELPPQQWIELVHTPEYVEGYFHGTLDAKTQRRIGLPWSEGLVHRTCIAVGGTILTAKLALEHGMACNTAGGTHHAFPDYGSGFCIFNDLAVAPSVMLQLGLVKKILIVDLDVHQGDGTAFIFQNDTRVFTFSMHCSDNFPGRKQASDIDIPLPQGLEDDSYLQILAKHLPELLSEVKPDLVFYDAGVDTHFTDRLGKLALTDTGLYQRDHFVLSSCWEAGYPIACVIGGGYSDDLDQLAQRHSLLHRAAISVFDNTTP